MQSDTTVVFIAAVFFKKKNNYYNSSTWPKKLHWELNKVIPSGMYNSSFEAKNLSLK